MFKQSMPSGWVAQSAADNIAKFPKTVPTFLKKRLVDGEDVISIWFRHHHFDNFKNLDEWLGIKVTAASESRQNLLPPIEEMSSKEILEFCKSIDVHPAHLIPLDNDPRLVLPQPLLETLLDLAYGKSIQGEAFAYDIKLAKLAIDYDVRRRQRYWDEEKQCFRKDSWQSDLKTAFESVLLSEAGLFRLSEENELMSQNFNGLSVPDYPLVMRVRNTAFRLSGLEMKFLRERVERKNKILEGRLSSVHTEFAKAVLPDCDDEMVSRYFVADVKDALSDANLDSRDATVDEIVSVVLNLQQENSLFIKAFDYMAEKMPGKFSKESFLIPVAESLWSYFQAEGKLSDDHKELTSVQKTYRNMTDNLYRVFDEGLCERGSVPYRLLNNWAVMALAKYENNNALNGLALK